MIAFVNGETTAACEEFGDNGVVGDGGEWDVFEITVEDCGRKEEFIGR
jgi:hypothetical protein